VLGVIVKMNCLLLEDMPVFPRRGSTVFLFKSIGRTARYIDDGPNSMSVTPVQLVFN
jgi:hypothetical protein